MTSPRTVTSPRGPTSPRTPLTSPHAHTGHLDGDTPNSARYTSLADLVPPDGSPSQLTPTRSRTTSGREHDWNFARGVEEENEQRERWQRQRRWSEAHHRVPPEIATKESKRLSLWKLICLTVSMGGSQVC